MAILSNDSTTGSRKILNSDNYQYNLSSYSNLIEAILDIGGEDATLYVPRGRWDAEGAVVPENIHLLFDKGGILTGNCEINGSWESPTVDKLFDGVITGNPNMREFYPEWFGATGDLFSYTDGVYIRRLINLIANANIKNSTIVFSGEYGVKAHLSTERVQPPSYTTLKFINNSFLKVCPNGATHYEGIFIPSTVRDVIVDGAIVYGDRYQHDYATVSSTHEWGHGIRIDSLFGNITVKNCVLKDCIGDGIFSYTLPAYDEGVASRGTQNINIIDCVCSNNRRQGLSIINGIGILVKGCIFEKTGGPYVPPGTPNYSGVFGTWPMAGIDIEPNFSYEPLDDIIIENCIFRDNYGGGLLFHSINRDHPFNITVKDCIFDGNEYPIWVSGTASVDEVHAKHLSSLFLEGNVARGNLVHTRFTSYTESSNYVRHVDMVEVLAGKDKKVHLKTEFDEVIILD